MAWQLLHYIYGLLPIIAGLDKYYNYLADWDIYLNAAIPAFFHIQSTTLLIGYNWVLFNY